MKTKNKTIIFIFILNIFASYSTFAASVEPFRKRVQSECSDIGLYNITDWFKYETDINILNEYIGEPRDQHFNGWCYAYSARDIIHFESGIGIDPKYIAKNYYNSITGKFYNLFMEDNVGGFTYTALNQTYSKGACLEGHIDRKATAENIPNIQCTSSTFNISGVGNLRKRERTHTGRSHPLFTAIDQLLMRNKIVGVEYNAEGLKYKSRRENQGFMRMYFANHASTIVGRFFDGESNSCRYIIRNTWGTASRSYNEGPQRAGYHSIREEELNKHLTNIIWID